MFSVYPSQLETSLYIRDDEEFRVIQSPTAKALQVVDNSC
jgi:hypothetical protein